MSSCAVPHCKNSGRKGSRMFQMPKNEDDASKWREFLIKTGAKKINQNSRICQDHFKIDDNGVRSRFPFINRLINKEVCLLN
jgi:hypothetical protein